jgi:hypothetical protein
MAQILLTAAGAAAGFMFGGPMGALKGASLGYSIGGMFADTPDKEGVVTRGPTLNDLRVAGTEYGQCIPWVKASVQTAGQMWWNTDKRPTVTRTQATEAAGGKGGGGGGGQTSVNEITTYDMDMLIGFTDNQIAAIPRVWFNGKLVWTYSTGFGDGEILWDRMTVYTGDPAQLPDPRYELAVGSDLAIAYRHRGSCFIQGLKLGQSGQMPTMLFEVVESATIEKLVVQELYTLPGGEDYHFSSFGNANSARLTSWSSRVVPGGEYIWVALRDSPSLIYPRRLGLFNNTTHELVLSKDYEASVTLVGIGMDGTSVWFEHHEQPSAFPTLKNISITGEELNSVPAPVSSFDLRNRHLYEVGFGVMYVQWDSTTAFRMNVYYTQNNGLTWTDQLTRIIPGLSTVEDQQDNWTFAMQADRIPGRLYVCGSHSGGAPFGPTNATIFYLDAASNEITLVREYDRATSGDALIGKDGFIYARSRNLNEANRYEKMDQDGNVVDVCVLPGVTSTQYALDSADEQAVIDENGRIVLNIGNDLWRITTSTMEIDATNSWADTDYRLITGDAYQGWGVLILTQEGTAGPNNVIRVLTDVFAADTRTIRHVQEALFDRAGLDASLYDASDLDDLPKPVRSLAVSQMGPTRSTMDMLFSCWFYEVVVSDKIYCRPRGGAAAATLAYDDLGAGIGEAKKDRFAPHQKNDIELPAQHAITYLNVLSDYENDTQLSDRLISATPNTVSAAQLAIGMWPSEAKAVADVWSLDQVMALITTKICLLGEHAKLEPTDPVIVLDRDGSSYRMRLTQCTDSYPSLEFDAVLDNVSILTSQGITSADYTSSTVLPSIPQTVARLLDIPILQDADDNSGFYWAGKWEGLARGAVLNASADNVTYEAVSLITSKATMGYAVTALGDWTGSRMFDEMSTVRVDMSPGAILTSSTRDLMLGDQAINAILIGNELMQFRDATIVSSGIYDLAGFIRGGRGSEWAMTGHAAGERVNMLAAGGIGRVPMENSEIGISKYYKAVTIGKAVGSAPATPFTNSAVGLKPFSPVAVRALKDVTTSTINITWQRRTRMNVRMIGQAGISVPLGEDSESYRINIYTSLAVFIRAYSSSTPSYPYTLAQQTLDFGGAATTFKIGIQQLGDVPGYETILSASV